MGMPGLALGARAHAGRRDRVRWTGSVVACCAGFTSGRRAVGPVSSPVAGCSADAPIGGFPRASLRTPRAGLFALRTRLCRLRARHGSFARKAQQLARKVPGLAAGAGGVRAQGFLLCAQAARGCTQGFLPCAQGSGGCVQGSGALRSELPGLRASSGGLRSASRRRAACGGQPAVAPVQARLPVQRPAATPGVASDLFPEWGRIIPPGVVVRSVA